MEKDDYLDIKEEEEEEGTVIKIKVAIPVKPGSRDS